MTPAPHRPTAVRRFIAVASVDRGALLWIPALLLAVAIALFAMRVAPSGVVFFPRTTSLRIAVTPCASTGTSAQEDAAFMGALRRGLSTHGELSLVDSVKVAARLATVPSRLAGTGMDALLHAVRPLNPHLLLRVRLQRTPELAGAIEAWDVRDRRPVVAFAVAGGSPRALGAAIAESLSTRLLEPQQAIAGLH